MIPLHPTHLALFARNCPKAVDHHMNHTPRDRDVFATGIAAHAILENIGRNFTSSPSKVADEVVRKLATEGRTYDKHPEPPLPLEACLEGRALALAWVEHHPPSPDALFEEGIAFDKDWKRVDYYSDAARFRTILDVVEQYEDGDEDGVWDVLKVIDYKTSWNDKDNALDNLQRHAQAVAAWKMDTGADIITVEIANLRTGGVYSRDIDTRTDVELLTEWQHELELAMDAVETTPRMANPGVRCLDCDFILQCKEAQGFHDNTTLVDMATRYVIAKQTTTALEDMIKMLTNRGAIETPEGVVGHVATSKCAPTGDAVAALWKEWTAKNGDVEGLLTVLGLSTTAIETVAKKLFGRGQWKEWVAAHVTEVKTSTFKVVKK